MIATADSKLNNNNWVKIKIASKEEEREFPVFP